MFDDVTNCPLTWPVGWARTQRRRGSTFDAGRRGRWTLSGCVQDALHQLKLMGVGDWNVVISTNVAVRLDGLPRSGQGIPGDPGVAVYFRFKKEPRVLACDKWDKPEHNLRAIVKHIEALRGINRWGVGSLEQAFTGYTAIPETSGGAGWWEILGCPSHAAPEEIEAAFKRRAMKAHPDRGGSHDEMAAVNDARKAGLDTHA